MTDAITLTLPYPPSVNRYYRNVRGRTLISAQGRAYRRMVADCVFLARAAKRLEGRLVVQVEVQPPDRRRRDIDNLGKSLFDSLQHAGVYNDDSQIDDLRIVRLPPTTGGIVTVKIREISNEKIRKTGTTSTASGNHQGAVAAAGE